jgi:hypothetical protein
MIVVDKSLIRENVIIWYRLPPRQLPKNRLKLWKGKVLRKGCSTISARFGKMRGAMVGTSRFGTVKRYGQQDLTN